MDLCCNQPLLCSRDVSGFHYLSMFLDEPNSKCPLTSATVLELDKTVTDHISHLLEKVGDQFLYYCQHAECPSYRDE